MDWFPWDMTQYMSQIPDVESFSGRGAHPRKCVAEVEYYCMMKNIPMEYGARVFKSFIAPNLYFGIWG